MMVDSRGSTAHVLCCVSCTLSRKEEDPDGCRVLGIWGLSNGGVDGGCVSVLVVPGRRILEVDLLGAWRGVTRVSRFAPMLPRSWSLRQWSSRQWSSVACYGLVDHKEGNTDSSSSFDPVLN
ncbi:uncharacterized protein HKW66_Vig0114370 [Vigna angularis]|uniref:Uncharacterized protein n=1 Tax=Phaseolus angularis TaxID=3914 RepID=A0A8T0L3E4_PHAAN|nr:uncharacterized protein HKW66_Vig0114370 [Vigna angularis]